MNNTQKLVIAFAVFAVLLAIFSGLQEGFSAIDVSAFPEPFAMVLTYLQQFFNSATFMIIIAYFRNLLGYAYNWLTLHKEKGVEFDFARYQKTILYYVSIINVFVAPLPEPFNFVAIIIGAFVDVLTSEWKKLQQAMGK